MLVKICGNKKETSSLGVARCQPDIMGWIFSDKSTRKIEAADAHNQISRIQYEYPGILHWGVFAKNSLSQINAVLEACPGIQTIQLVEELPLIREWQAHIKPGVQIVPAIRLQTKLDQNEQQKYKDFKYLVLDSFEQGKYGGTGRLMAPGLIDEVDLPYFLAGGLNVDNLKKTLASLKSVPVGVDVSSGVESSNHPGQKDLALVMKFIQIVRELSR